MSTRYSGLEQFILDSGIIPRGDFLEYHKTSSESGVPFDEFLVNRGVFDEDEMRRIWAHVLGVPFIRIDAAAVPLDVFVRIPEPLTRLHKSIAIGYDEKGVLEVALLDMKSFIPIRDYCDQKHIVARPRFVGRENMNMLLKQYQIHMRNEYGSRLSEYIDEVLHSESFKKTTHFKGIQALQDGSRLDDIFHTIISHAQTQHVHDIHLEYDNEALRVRYRIGETLHESMVLPKMIIKPLVAHIKFIAGMSVEEELLPQEKRVTLSLSDDSIPLRIATIPTHSGEKITIHIIPEYSNGYTLESLGFSSRMIADVRSALSKPGLIVVSGPAGSGKTTTLYTLLDLINRPEKAVVTIESEIGFVMPHVSQVRLNSEAGLTTLSAIRAALKQDVDVLMVGDIRDAQTLNLLLQAASRGVTVIAGMHAESAAAALVDMRHTGVDPHMLASNVSLILSSRLIPRLCDTKTRRFLKKPELSRLEDHIDTGALITYLIEEGVLSKKDTLEKVAFYFPKRIDGNAECPGGYKGVVGVHECLPMSAVLRDAITSRVSTENLLDRIVGEYSYTMREDAVYKAIQGHTSLEHVYI